MNEKVMSLVPNKPDSELAEELKKEFIEASKPLCELLGKASKLGFQINFAVGPTPTGHRITSLIVAKYF